MKLAISNFDRSKASPKKLQISSEKVDGDGKPKLQCRRTGWVNIVTLGEKST